MSERVPSGTWWHVYPLGFLGAPREAAAQAGVAHRLPALLPWLSYAAELGMSGLALGPVFASETHGYDTVDHRVVDPRLGDTEDLVAVFRTAHELGLQVVLDGVFNHVGRRFEPFVRALEDGPAGPTASWFRLRWPAAGGEPDADVFEGHARLVELDHNSPDVARYVSDVMRYWCDLGADGWRLDAAYAVPPSFWAPVLAELHTTHPDAWVFGEVIHGDYAEIVRSSGMDSVTQYELWKAIGSAIVDRNFFELAHALGRHAELLSTFVPVTFLGNHDTTRIASRLDDRRHVPHAVAVLLGVAGTPVVYSGDEQGFTGVKFDRLGGDDEVRPPFPERPDQLSKLGEPMLDVHRQLIALRRARPWLADGVTEVSHLTNTTLVLTTSARNVLGPGEPSASSNPDGTDRTDSPDGTDAPVAQDPLGSPDGRRIAVALSLEDEPTSLPLPGGSWTVAAGVGEVGPGAVRLPAHGWAVLV